jgi:hypothetical protein
MINLGMINLGMINRPTIHRNVVTRLSRDRAVGANDRSSNDRGSALAWCLLTALVFGLPPCAQAQPGVQSGVKQRYGNFSVVWPAQPQLVQHQATSTLSYAIYAVTLTPVTFTFSFLQFSSPQELVSPQDFAHNQTSSPPGATILSIGTAKLAGYTADQVIYRIGQTTYLAWSVQPTRQVNYVISVAGLDSPAFRQRAQQFAGSFSAAQ